MAGWTVKKYVKPNGRCPIDEWLNSNAVTLADEAALDSAILALESHKGAIHPPEKFKKLEGDIYEVKATAPGKALRPLATKVGDKKQIILLLGIVKKGGVYPRGDLKAAKGLAKQFAEGKGSVKEYWPENESNMEQDDQQRLS